MYIYIYIYICIHIIFTLFNLSMLLFVLMQADTIDMELVEQVMDKDPPCHAAQDTRPTCRLGTPWRYYYTILYYDMLYY